MAVIPVSKIGKIEFYQVHLPSWIANAAAIGTSPDAVSDLEAKTAAAREAYAAHRAARDVARVATQSYYNAVAEMKSAGSAIIRQIRSKAETSGSKVLTLAMLPAIAARSPKGAPGTPGRLKTELCAGGALRLKWKCKNPANTSGTMYEVWRRIGAVGEFVFLGSVGSRQFMDATIPAGTAQITYQIRGVRSTVRGSWAQFVVTFGGGGQEARSFQTKETQRAAA